MGQRYHSTGRTSAKACDKSLDNVFLPPSLDLHKQHVHTDLNLKINKAARLANRFPSENT